MFFGGKLVKNGIRFSRVSSNVVNQKENPENCKPNSLA
jgi:hypothetical protein